MKQKTPERERYLRQMCEKVISEREKQKRNASKKMIVVNITEEAKKLNAKRVQ